MGGEVLAAMWAADRLKWWPPRDRTRSDEELAARRAERSARARRRTRGENR